MLSPAIRGMRPVGNPQHTGTHTLLLCNHVSIYICTYIYIYIYIYSLSLFLYMYPNTPFTHTALPCDPSAETALKPLMWCFERLSAQESFFAGIFVPTHSHTHQHYSQAPLIIQYLQYVQTMVSA